MLKKVSDILLLLYLLLIIESSSGVSESMTYAGLTYYEVKGVEDLVTFTAAKRLNALLEVITYYIQY